MAQLTFTVANFKITPPKAYVIKGNAEVRFYARIECKGMNGGVYRMVFLRPDGLQPWQSTIEDKYDPSTKTAITYRLPHEYAWVVELLASGKVLTVHLDSVNPLTNRIEAAPAKPLFMPPPTPDVHAWIAANPIITLGIGWADASGYRGFDLWTISEKDALTDAFAGAWATLPSGLADPPANIAEASFADAGGAVLDGKDAFALYVAHLAQSFVIEIGGRVPWSLFDYGDLDRMRILGMNSMFWWNEAYGGHKVDGQVLPAPPDVAYAFLVENDILRSTRLETISALLDWCRRNLSHAFVHPSWADPALEEHLAFWGYVGEVPASRMIQGTVAKVPGGWQWNHWTSGCQCTADFLKSVLRLINIPSAKRSFNGGHATIEYPSEGRFLSHGDDPYSSLSKATPDFPASELLIDQAKFESWFDSNATIPQIQANVGRRTAELAIAYLPDSLLNDHYLDRTEQLPPGESRVFEQFKQNYTVADLTDVELWERLDEKLANFEGIYMKKKWPKPKPKKKKKPWPPSGPPKPKAKHQEEAHRSRRPTARRMANTRRKKKR